jgi:hypothetical protein
MVWANACLLAGRIFVTQAAQPMDLHRFWDGVITSSSNLTRLRNQATALRNHQEFQRSLLTELASTDFESGAKESYEIATKIAYRNGDGLGFRRPGLWIARWSQRLPCFLRDTLLVRAGLRIGG